MPSIVGTDDDRPPRGFGVEGTSVHGAGIRGLTASTEFGASGVLGEATAASGQTVGVVGHSTESPIGTGTVGIGNATGGYFETNGKTGARVGVYGIGFDVGVSGRSKLEAQGEFGEGGIGVYGENDLDRGIGVRGQAMGDAGVGVSGSSSHGIGVRGHSTDGSGVYGASDRGPGIHGVGQLAGRFEGPVEADGNLTVIGTATVDVLEITGGADLAELFAIDRGGVDVGTVVSIDPHHEGQLKVSDAEGDRGVAGVVVADPGIVLGADRRVGAWPIALAGRAPCKADARDRPIVPGDLLTTGALPGHAIAVAPGAQVQGAILGKALTGLGAGTGHVVVLLALG